MKKEIIIVTISLGNDGAERILTELARQWVHDGHHITVIQTSPNRYGNEYALENGIEQIEIHTTSSNKVIRFMQEIKELIKILKTRPNATCLSFLSASSFILAISSWFVKNRIVFSERNNPRKVPIGWHQQALRNFAFRFADALVFQTEDARSYFPESVQKRGVIEDELRAQIKSLNLEDRILLPGFASNILEKVAPCSMYVSSSDFEGISNSMLEALGMGLPTVVTDCPVGGARMVITSGENGILVPVGDTKAMYEAMRSVLKDPTLATKLSQEAIKVRDKFPLCKIAKRWLDVL